MKMFHLCVECEVASQEIPGILSSTQVMWPGAGQPERDKSRLQLIGHGRSHVTRRGPIRAIQHCKWLHRSHSKSQAVNQSLHHWYSSWKQLSFPHVLNLFQRIEECVELGEENEHQKINTELRVELSS